MAAIGTSSVDRLARSKRPIVERAEIHIPPVPTFPMEAVTGDPRARANAIASFNNALQKWRNDAWSVEAPFVPDAALQNRATALEDTTGKMSTKLDRAVVDIRHIDEQITEIDNSITTINNEITNINEAITGTGIVQANGSEPPSAITGSTGHFPYWQPMSPFLSSQSPVWTNGTLVGVGTVAPVSQLHVTTTDATGTVVTDVLRVEHKVAAFMGVGGGTGVVWAGASDSAVDRDMARIQARWTTATDATRASALDIQTVTGGTLTTRVTIDASGRVGIGTTTPTGRFHIAGDTTITNLIYVTDNATIRTVYESYSDTATVEPQLGLRHARGTLAVPTSTQLNDSLASIRFAGYNAAAGQFQVGAGIFAFADGGFGTAGDTTDSPGRLELRTTPDGSSTGVTRIYIAGAGNVGIGTGSTAPGALLDVGLAGTTLGVLRLAGNTSGNVTIQAQPVAGTWTLQLPQNDGGSGDVLTTDGGGITSWTTPATVTPSALTRVDDTNVTLTLGGSPAVALLAATSLTLGWTGVLAIARGGTNASSFAAASGVVYFDGTSLVNSADLFYASSELVSRGVSLNGINEPYLARNINTGANAGTGYEAELADTSNNLITAGYITWFKEQSWTTTASTQDSSATIGTTLDGTTIAALLLHSSGSVVCGKDATGTTRITDFLYIPSSAGNPTGVADEYGSRCPLVYDTTNNELFAYNPLDNTWRSAVFT